MADYTEDSQIIFEDNVIKGLLNIKVFFYDFITNILPFPIGTELEITHTQVSGALAYIIWKASTDKLTFKFGTDTFVILNGKILHHTAAALIEPN